MYKKGEIVVGNKGAGEYSITTEGTLAVVNEDQNGESMIIVKVNGHKFIVRAENFDRAGELPLDKFNSLCLQ